MKKLLSLVAVLAPSVAFAQTGVITDANSLTTKLVGLGNIVIYLLISLAVLYIIWNVVQYFIHGAGEEGRGKSGMNILWGIVGLAIILSIWGLVAILVNTFRTTPSTQNIPNLDSNTSAGGLPGQGIPHVY